MFSTKDIRCAISQKTKTIAKYTIYGASIGGFIGMITPLWATSLTPDPTEVSDQAYNSYLSDHLINSTQWDPQSPVFLAADAAAKSAYKSASTWSTTVTCLFAFAPIIVGMGVGFGYGLCKATISPEVPNSPASLHSVQVADHNPPTELKTIPEQKLQSPTLFKTKVPSEVQTTQIGPQFLRPYK